MFDSHDALIVNCEDLEALLDYVQSDEEHDFEENEEAGSHHIVHTIRRLRARLDQRKNGSPH